MERTLVAFTTTLFAVGAAHASAPTTNPRFELQTTRDGLTFARQPVVPTAAATTRAQTRTIYLNRWGAIVLPGINDSRLSTSSIVTEPVAITPWEIDDEMWADTVACVRDLFADFDVAITDAQPDASVAYLEAVFGGHPADVGLPDYVAGVSPFTTDCSVIERSIVYTFTDVLPDDARLMCEVMAQEIAHSYGLDHQLLAEDPMSYLPYDGERTFQDQDAACGEDEPRPCGIAGTVCRATQNSVALLRERLGARAGSAGNTDQGDTTPGRGVAGGGCSSGGATSPGIGWALIAVLRRRFRRSP